MESIYNLPILIVDDSQSNILLAKIFLEQKGFTNLSSANHVTDALQHLKHNACSLLLLDLLMPDISGLEMMNIMNKDSSFNTPATIFVTAASDENTLGECFESGAVDFIRKPLDSGIELIARVTRALKEVLAIEDASEKMHIDALSTLYNRRYFDERFLEVYEKSISLGRTFHFLMIDIDNFKSYNDNYGHLAGDHIITSIADSLQDSVKSLGNLVFRLGGEEFAAIFSTTNGENIMTTIKSVCRNIEKLNIPHAYSVFPYVTVSAGFISTSSEGYDYKTLYEACDGLLYEAKHSGKNKVVHKKL